MPKYNSLKAGKQIQLSLPPFKNTFACCGCGLVHEHVYEIKRETRKNRMTLWCTVLPAERATAQIRRHRKDFIRTKKYYVVAIPRPQKRKPKHHANARRRS